MYYLTAMWIDFKHDLNIILRIRESYNTDIKIRSRYSTKIEWV